METWFPLPLICLLIWSIFPLCNFTLPRPSMHWSFFTPSWFEGQTHMPYSLYSSSDTSHLTILNLNASSPCLGPNDPCQAAPPYLAWSLTHCTGFPHHTPPYGYPIHYAQVLVPHARPFSSRVSSPCSGSDTLDQAALRLDTLLALLRL